MATLKTEFEVTCPCCQSTLVVDAGLKRVVRHVEVERADKPKLDEAHSILAAEKASELRARLAERIGATGVSVGGDTLLMLATRS